jgi:hypothetical protein
MQNSQLEFRPLNVAIGNGSWTQCIKRRLMIDIAINIVPVNTLIVGIVGPRDLSSLD